MTKSGHQLVSSIKVFKRETICSIMLFPRAEGGWLKTSKVTSRWQRDKHVLTSYEATNFIVLLSRQWGVLYVLYCLRHSYLNLPVSTIWHYLPYWSCAQRHARHVNFKNTAIWLVIPDFWEWNVTKTKKSRASCQTLSRACGRGSGLGTRRHHYSGSLCALSTPHLTGLI